MESGAAQSSREDKGTRLFSDEAIGGLVSLEIWKHVPEVLFSTGDC